MITASLTTEGITLHNARTKQKSRSGCFPAGSPAKINIPFENVLWAEIVNSNEASVKLSYARDINDDKSKYVNTMDTVVFKAENDSINTICKTILSKAYPEGCRKKKKLLILINPHGGQGRAHSIYKQHCEPMLNMAKCSIEIISTTHRYHAQEIAKDLDLDKYDGIICCSGDGIPHEVLNGFAERTDYLTALKTMPICQLPCGSGNSMAVSLNGNPSPTRAALCIVKGRKMPIDLMSFNQKNNTKLSFLSQNYGVVADADLGTEHMRWMGGARFTVGAVMKCISKKPYPCEVYVKYAHENKNNVRNHFHSFLQTSKSETNVVTNNVDSAASSTNTEPHGSNSTTTNIPLKYGTTDDKLPDDWQKLDKPNMGVFFVGKMPWVSADALIFPATLPTDGTIDMVHWDSSIGRLKALSMFTKVQTGQHFESPEVSYSKVEAYRLVPHIDGYLSIDGESFPCEPFQVEVLPSLGCLLSISDGYTHSNLSTH